MMSPNEVITLFISAYHEWNVRSNDLCKKHDNGSIASQQAISLAEKEYADLIKQFCTDTVSPQPISFGDDPMHSPTGETIQSISIDGDAALARTKQIGFYNTISEYEYHLKQTDDEWKIESLQFFDEDGKFECL